MAACCLGRRWFCCSQGWTGRFDNVWFFLDTSVWDDSWWHRALFFADSTHHWTQLLVVVLIFMRVASCGAQLPNSAQQHRHNCSAQKLGHCDPMLQTQLRKILWRKIMSPFLNWHSVKQLLPALLCNLSAFVCPFLKFCMQLTWQRKSFSVRLHLLFCVEREHRGLPASIFSEISDFKWKRQLWKRSY